MNRTCPGASHRFIRLRRGAGEVMGLQYHPQLIQTQNAKIKSI